MLSALRARRARLNPAAEIHEVVHGAIDPAVLLRDQPHEAAAAADVERWLRERSMLTRRSKVRIPTRASARSAFIPSSRSVRQDLRCGSTCCQACAAPICRESKGCSTGKEGEPCCRSRRADGGARNR